MNAPAPSVLIDFSTTADFREDEDGYPAVRLRDKVWADEPEQWLTFRGVGRDAQARVDELIAALTKVRDVMGGGA